MKKNRIAEKKSEKEKRKVLSNALIIHNSKLYLGGYSAEVPPLPIPNRVVKLSHADGTALVVGE